VSWFFTNLLELEDLAKAKLPKSVFDYLAGGAGDELSLRRNREAYHRWVLRPNVLVDVSNRSTVTQILGEQIAMPIITAPTAFHGLVNPEGELASVRGTGDAGTIFVASTLSTRSLEEVAAERKGPLWFQLYVSKDRGATERLVERAVKAGYCALCVTVDTPISGRRERDERNSFILPENLQIPNLEGIGMDRMKPTSGSAFAAHFTQMLDPTLTWKDIDWLQAISPLPIVLKGIMRHEDARLAVQHGAKALVVSNHGGRQLDDTPGTIDVLPEIVEAVDGQIEVLVDGGIRRGTDVLKALALGADAVLVGRPIVWGLTISGREGVRAVLEHLRAELDSAMALVGRRTVREIDRTLIQQVK
jgi:4-hydroxymandelate oxidase